MHPQTLRIYESKGLVRPGRTPGGTRLYSEHDLDRLRLIQRLTTELGLNLAGVSRVIALEDELAQMRARFERLERQMREAVEHVHRQYRRDLVLYREAPAAIARMGRSTQMDFDRLTIKSQEAVAAAQELRAPPREPGDLPGAPAVALLDQELPRALVAGRPGATSRDGGVLAQKPSRRGPAQQPRARPPFAKALDRAFGRGEEARGRLRLERAPAARARRRPSRRTARADQGVRGGQRASRRIPRARPGRSRSSAAT